ncbi:MAG: hypothetical protein ACRC6P_07880 [Shewanella oncorhynchi]
MGLPVTMYRWDDAGAPQLSTSRKPSEVINILKKCLVEGYGDKQSLGWTKEFEDTATQKVVFRNSLTNGSGGFVRFASLGGSDAAATVMLIRTGLSMTNIDTFTKETSLQRVISTSAFTSVQWFLIGTSTAFYFIISASNSTRMAGINLNLERGCFVGDFKSYIPGDQCKFIALADRYDGAQPGHATSYDNAFYGNFYTSVSVSGSVSGNSAMTLYGADGSAESKNYTIACATTLALDNNPPAAAPKMGLFCVANVVINGTPISSSLSDTTGVRVRNSVRTPLIRGELPGLKIEVMSRYTSETWPVTEVIDNVNHWLLRTGSYATGLWINMVEW